jgi:hypothetical protein
LLGHKLSLNLHVYPYPLSAIYEDWARLLMLKSPSTAWPSNISALLR